MKYPHVVAQIGDRDPLNWGGYIMDHGDGRPTLEYMIGSEGTYWVHRVDILDIETDIETAKSRHGWIKIGDVVRARSCGESVRTLIRAARGSWLAKAQVIEICASYYGWGEFDAYETTMTEKEAQRWADKMDRKLRQWERRKNVTSYTYDAAYLAGWDAADEAEAKYGRGRTEEHTGRLKYRGPGPWSDWDRGYFHGYRDCANRHQRHARQRTDFVDAYPLVVGQ